MTPLDVLTGLRRTGFTVVRDGDALRVSPASNLTDRDKAIIREHKAELLVLLSDEGRAVLGVGSATGPKAPASPVYWVVG
jgi:hypothetical protein